MGLLTTRTFEFFGPPRKSEYYQVYIEFGTSVLGNTCAICSARGTMLTIHARITLKDENGAVSQHLPAGRAVRQAVPHGKGFCRKHESYIERSIDRGILSLGPQRTKKRA